MADYIKLGFNILLLILIAFGFLWGIIRGLKKTVGRGLFLILTSILLIFIAVPITNLILKIGINCNIETESLQLVGRYNIAEILTEVVKSYVGADFVTKYPEFANVIVSFVIILVNSIVYLVLFWLLKYLLLPLNSLLTKLIFPAKKAKKEVQGFASTDDTVDSEAIVAGVEAKSTPKKIKKEKAPKVKEKKRRLLGGLVGIVTGLIVTFNTMLPMYGILDIVESAKTLKIENISGETGDLDTITGGTLSEITEGYRASIMSSVSKYSGLESAGLVGFDAVTTTKINGEKIILRDEVNSLLDTIEHADSLLGKYNEYSKDNFSTITQTQLDELLSDTKVLIGKCEKVKIVDCLADYMLPIACSYMIKSDIKLTSNDLVNEMVKDTLVTIINASGIDVMKEINSLLDIAEYTSTQGLLIKVVKGDTSEPLKLIDGLEENFGKNLITKVFDLQTVDVALPHLFNIGLTYFDQISSFEYSESEINKETLKTSLIRLVDDAFKVAITMDSESPVMLTFDSISPTGKLLETIKSSGLINEATYNSAVTFTTQKLRELTNDILPDNIKEYFIDVINNQIIGNIDAVENWETEMNTISQAINQLRINEGGIIGNIVEGSEIRQGNSINFVWDEATINNLGKALDILENTTIFGKPLTQQVDKDSDYCDGTTITKIIASVCDYVNSNIAEDSSVAGFKDVIKSIRENVISASHTYNPNNANFYELEFKQISPLLVELNNIISGEDIDLNKDLGTKLDKAKSSVIFGNKTTLILVKEAMNTVSDGILGSDYTYNPDEATQDTNDKIYELFEGIKEELDSPATLNASKSNSNFWEHEIDSYLALKNIAENSGNIASSADILPYGVDLDTAYTSITIPKDKLNNVIAFTIKKLKTSATTGVEGKINELIDEIADGITNETFANPLKDYNNYWQIELTHIHSLSTLEFSEKEDNPETPDIDESFTYSDIGLELDKVTLGYTKNGDIITSGYIKGNENTTRESYLISHNMLRSLLGAGIDELKASILDGFEMETVKEAIERALVSIKSNIIDVTNIPTISFEKELGNLGSLAKLEIDSNIFDNTSKLNSLGESLDKISYNKENNTIYNESNNSKIITRLILSTLIKDVLPIAKSEEPEESATDKVVDGMIENINDIINKDKVISWQREFNLVSKVMELKDITISDSTYEKIGNTIDSIAFNKIGSTYNFNDLEFNTDGSINTDNTDLIASANSLLISRSMLNTNIADIIKDMVKTEENEIIKDTLNSIASSIETNSKYIYSWEKEIGKVNELKNLNSTTIYSSDIDLPSGTTIDEYGNITFPEGSNYTLEDNTLIKFAKNIDAISFNNNGSSYLDTTFDTNNIVQVEGTNSIIITRTILRDMMTGFLNNAKPDGEEEEDEIAKDFIDNTTNKVNTSKTISSTLFTSFVDSFTALITANTQIKNVAEEFSDIDLKDISLNRATSIDIMLENLQGNLISGITTTKKVAKLILNKINTKMQSTSIGGITFGNSEIGKYITYLIGYYNPDTNVSVESYHTDVDSYPLKNGEDYVTTNPFATIVSNYSSLINQES